MIDMLLDAASAVAGDDEDVEDAGADDVAVVDGFDVVVVGNWVEMCDVASDVSMYYHHHHL